MEHLEEELTCAICLETLNIPKTLPCLHSFCEECLLEIAGNKSTIPCPSCRTICSLPGGKVQSLPTNFVINSIVDKLKSSSFNSSSQLNSVNSNQINFSQPPPPAPISNSLPPQFQPDQNEINLNNNQMKLPRAWLERKFTKINLSEKGTKKNPQFFFN